MEYARSRSAKEAGEIFGMGVRTVFEWRRLLKENGNLEGKPLNKKPRSLDMDGLRVCGGTSRCLVEGNSKRI
jgi:transposase